MLDRADVVGFIVSIPLILFMVSVVAGFSLGIGLAVVGMVGLLTVVLKRLGH